jgi:hypothetical protein
LFNTLGLALGDAEVDRRVWADRTKKRVPDKGLKRSSFAKLLLKQAVRSHTLPGDQADSLLRLNSEVDSLALACLLNGEEATKKTLRNS